MTIRDVYNTIDVYAPFESQADFDHSGLQVGDFDAPVKGVLVAVDLSFAVIDEAIAQGCNAIVVHHPPIWNPLGALTEEEYVQRMARRLVQNDLHLIAAHTNVDNCAGGNSERIIALLGGKVTGRLDCDPYAVTFEMPAISMRDLQGKVQRDLEDPYAYGVGADGIVSKGALCTGSGFSYASWLECKQKDLVYMTGEVKHNNLREVQDQGGHLVVFGHFASERIFMDIIKEIMDVAQIPCVKSKQDSPAGIR